MTPGPTRILLLLPSLLLIAATDEAAPTEAPTVPEVEAEAELGPIARPSPYAILGGRLLATPPFDPALPCGPESGVAGEVKAALGAGDADLARERLGSLDAAHAEHAFVSALVQARTAQTAAEARATRAALAAALAARPREGSPPGSGPSGAGRACLRVESARFELLRGRHPEAGAEARRGVARANAVGSAALAERARFLRAEALLAAGRPEEAEPLYRGLARAGDVRVAAAARLRLIDVLFERGEALPRRAEYEKLLARGEDFGARPEAWGLRAAELAIAAGDPRGALDWLQRYARSEPGEVAAAVARVRSADVRAALGQGVHSRVILSPIADKLSREPVGALARVRAIDLGVLRAAPESRIGELRRSARHPHRGVARYASAVLGRELRESGELDAALAVLLRLAHDALAPELEAGLSEELDALLVAAVEEAAEDDGCLRLLSRVGGRRDLFARHARRPDPLLRLARCFEHVGLPDGAQDVYRRLAHQFGGESAGLVHLPLARAAFASGDLPAVRTTAVAWLRRGGPDADEWRLLHGLAELRDQRLASAARVLRPLVRRGAPEGERWRALASFARAIAPAAVTAEDRRLLARALGERPAEVEAEQGAWLGEAALVAGRAYRDARRRAPAYNYFSLARTLLPPGARRGEAAYWAGALAAERPDALDAWTAASAEAALWARLADHELRMVVPRSAFGRTASGAKRP